MKEGGNDHVTINVLLFSYFIKLQETALGYPDTAVTLTHQWGSLVAVTTMISSFEKESCSELTALQSTRALTSL